ncbi:MAG: peptidoglycan editing factor PgeF [Balneolaceae bacterium]|nr:peptidoglycan editing factor PgeF [Balneolaceae bacterium]
MIKIYSPEIFKETDNVQCVFTEANRTTVNENGAIPGLNLGYNTSAGDDEIDKNFSDLFASLDWDQNQIALAEQVHGAHIETVNKPGTRPSTDGLVTNVTGLPIGIRVADCAAVLIADPVQKVAGAFHAGWKGAASDIIPNGIDRMVQLGAKPGSMYVFISPCISEENFEVGEEVAVRFPEKFVNRINFKKPHIDLKGFIIDQLIQKGVDTNNIECSSSCTMEDDIYYSYRRERDRAGRMLAMIKLI